MIPTNQRPRTFARRDRGDDRIIPRERQPWDTNRALLAAPGAAGGLLALWVGWGLYTSRSAEDVPYERVGTVGGVEVRRYRSRRGHRTNEVAVDVPGSAV